MKRQVSQKDQVNLNPTTVATLTIGFILAICLTVCAYMVVVYQWLPGGWWTIGAIVGLAVVQLIVQLIFFLHFGRESKPRWNLAAFFFMLIFLLIIVVGSLWIMSNLNYNMMTMTPEQMDSYMIDQSGAGF